MLNYGSGRLVVFILLWEIIYPPNGNKFDHAINNWDVNVPGSLRGEHNPDACITDISFLIAFGHDFVLLNKITLKVMSTQKKKDVIFH